MTPVGFEPTAPAGERPQTYALDRATTETVFQYEAEFVSFLRLGSAQLFLDNLPTSVCR